MATATLSLPEKIGPADLEALNQAVGALIAKLRFARGIPAGEFHGRHSAVVALSAAWGFFLRFEPVRADNLHVPLLSLHSALLALDENNPEPMLTPTKRTGRAPSSPRHYVLIGIAVGASLRPESTGLSTKDSNKAVAAKLNALGVKPTRGKNGVTADTLRRWRGRINETRPLLRSLPQLNLSDISAEDIGWINAATIADEMLTEEWRAKLAALAPAEARRFILDSLDASVREIALANPAKPPS